MSDRRKDRHLRGSLRCKAGRRSTHVPSYLSPRRLRLDASLHGHEALTLSFVHEWEGIDRIRLSPVVGNQRLSLYLNTYDDVKNDLR